MNKNKTCMHFFTLCHYSKKIKCIPTMHLQINYQRISSDQWNEVKSALQIFIHILYMINRSDSWRFVLLQYVSTVTFIVHDEWAETNVWKSFRKNSIHLRERERDPINSGSCKNITDNWTGYAFYIHNCDCQEKFFHIWVW